MMLTLKILAMISLVACGASIFALSLFNHNAGAGFIISPEQQAALAALFGFLASSFWQQARLLGMQQHNQHHVRQRERASIHAEEASQQVQALEAKIDTLEKALASALSRQS